MKDHIHVKIKQNLASNIRSDERECQPLGGPTSRGADIE